MQDVVAHKGARHPELHVCFKIHVVVHVNLRDVCLVSLLIDEEMQMRGPHVVAARQPDKIAHRSIDGNRITRWPYGAKADTAIDAGSELSTKVHVRLNGVLVFVESFG